MRKLQKRGRELTTICTGGDVTLCVVENQTDLKQFLQEHDEYYILGYGSNVLIPDTGLSKPLLQLGGDFKKLEIFDDHVFIGSAYSLMTAARKLSGIVPIEFAAGIPASIGGAVKMNAGAHKAEMSSVIHEIHTVLSNGEIKIFNNPVFEYRHTNLPNGSVVTGVSLKKSASDLSESQAKLEANLSYRKQTQPLTLPSFGSVFKNPDGHSAGELIEKAGLKGKVMGDVMISSLHANWIVNPHKTGQTDDILRLIDLCKETVFSSFGVSLEEEVVKLK